MDRCRKGIDDMFGGIGRVCAACPLREEAASAVAGQLIRGPHSETRGHALKFTRSMSSYFLFYYHPGTCVFPSLKLLHHCLGLFACLFSPSCFLKIVFGNFVCGMSP